MSVFCQAVVCLLLALPTVAQSQEFATITINPARSADPRNARVQVLPNGNLIASAVPVITLLSYAYDVPVNPLSCLSWKWRERSSVKITERTTCEKSESTTLQRRRLPS